MDRCIYKASPVPTTGLTPGGEGRVNRFHHSGRVADIIYSLPTVRALGGGEFLLHPNSQVGFSLAAAKSLIPLLEAQPYITRAKIYEGEEIDFDLDLFREGDAWRENLADAHLLTFGLDPSEKDVAWLEAPPAEESRPVVFGRSEERRGHPRFWEFARFRFGHCARLVGSLHESYSFCFEVGHVEYLWTKDMLELAQAIQGCELFLGNQSAYYAIAEGLKKTAVQERCMEVPNCLFERPNCLSVGYEPDFWECVLSFARIYAPKAVDIPLEYEAEALSLIPESAKRVLVFHEPPERGVQLVQNKIPGADVRSAPDGRSFDCIASFVGHAAPDLVGDAIKWSKKDTRLIVPSGGCEQDLAAALWRRDASSGRAFVAAKRVVPPLGPFAGELGPGCSGGASVVVLTYNSAGTIERCLTSVLKTLGRYDEIVVVDNASQDDTVEKVCRCLSGPLAGSRVRADQSPDELEPVMKTERATFLRSGKNLGYSAGCNAGILRAKGQLVVLLNPDTTVPPTWMNGITYCLVQPSVAAIGPLSDCVAGAQFVGFHLPLAERRLLTLDQIERRVRKLHTGEYLEARSLIGFCIAFNRAALDMVGLLDEDLFLGGDDLEMSLRLRARGFRLLIARDVFVHHEGGRSFASLAPEEGKKLLAQSTAVLHRKLKAMFAPGPVPSSMDLFGVGILPPADEREAAVSQNKEKSNVA